MVSTVNSTSSGLRPTRSDSEPMTGSQKKLEMATHSVTMSASVVLRCSTALPKVGV
ncbi:hypothetical protein FQZ97_490880 [compost metagenome]